MIAIGGNSSRVFDPQTNHSSLFRWMVVIRNLTMWGVKNLYYYRKMSLKERSLPLALPICYIISP